MDIEALKTTARQLAREMTGNVQDVDDSLVVRRTRLKSEIGNLVPDADGTEDKSHDDVIEDIYAHAAAEFECPEEVTPQLVLREISVALDHIKTKTGRNMWHHAIRESAMGYHAKQDLKSVRDLLDLMPRLREQVVDLRKNYGVMKAGTNKVEWWASGWEEVLTMLDYVDFCTEFLEREKTRLESGPMAA
ncbi:hypothetical protein [Rhizobium sp. BK176]|uniref:hypothetical protein n=1 Tax=Rhizobium sp. BK176 TaxID=2587071 RepID=UPI002168B527|nr:hypothetical protein [Rhizobium sp. BK176]MCS4088878.1 hypothetical protein [Rhizobium sp. BK176]